MLTGSICLTARNLTKRFITSAETIRAADGISLEIAVGEFVCLHGPSGCGKSTLLHLLGGLLTPDEGEIILDGVAVHELSLERRTALRLDSVGLVFQQDNLIEEFRAWENVAFMVEATGASSVAAKDAASAALDLVGVGDLAERFPRQLSGGQRQRVGIARALVGGKRLILADEPSGALDSQASQDLYQLFGRLSSDGIAIVVASHDPECQKYATRSLEMRDGRIL